MSRIGHALETWFTTGSFPVVMGKLFLGMAVFGGVVASPFLYLTDHPKRSLDERFKTLDGGVTVVFNSVVSCEEKKYSHNLCIKAQKEAMSIASSQKTSWTYPAPEQCKAVHGVCLRKTVSDTEAFVAGDVQMMTTSESSSYAPQIVGWQAMARDLSQAVPLYATSASNVAIRKDHKRVAFN